MHTTLLPFKVSRRRPFARILAPAVLVALLIVGHAQVSSAQTSGPKRFSSAGEASDALFQAVRSHDDQAIEAILGAGKEITSTGDDAADKLEREHFARKYQEMHRLVREPDGATVLYIGAENWPFPIPLTSRNGAWSFDAETGMEEILVRQIGENESTALDVCRGLVGATPYTPPPPNEPFHGYYFRRVGVPPQQREPVFDAYVSGGKRVIAAAFVAYPAEYRSSGVMTFIVGMDGKVYERDLGPNTSRLAPAITERKPASAWHVVNATDAVAAPTSSGSY